MKSKLTLALIMMSIGILASFIVVHAPLSTLGTGYAIDSNYHGVDVPLGTPVTVTAFTLDHSVVQVTFRWHMPNDTVRWEVAVPVLPTGTYGTWNNGTSAEILTANNTQIPDVLGDWGVQAFFQDSTGKDKAGLEDVIKTKATSFNAIPEVPLGTIAIFLAMLGALGILAIKKKPRLAFTARTPS